MHDVEVLLTRPVEESQEISLALQKLGIKSICLPMIKVVDCNPSETGTIPKAMAITIAKHECPEENHPPTVLLTSLRATERWLRWRKEKDGWPKIGDYFVVGDKSAELLRQQDPTTPVTAVANSIDALLNSVAQLSPAPVPDKLLYPCSLMRLPQSVAGFKAMGYKVFELPLYKPTLPKESLQRITRSFESLTPNGVITFFSPSAVRNMIEALKQNNLDPNLLNSYSVVAIGATTAETLQSFGVKKVETPLAPTLSDIFPLIQSLLPSRSRAEANN